MSLYANYDHTGDPDHDPGEIEIGFLMDGQVCGTRESVMLTRDRLDRDIERFARWTKGTDERAAYCARLNLLGLLKLRAIMDELGAHFAHFAGECRPCWKPIVRAAPPPTELHFHIQDGLIAMGAQ